MIISYIHIKKIVLQKVLLHEAIFPTTCDATDDNSIARQVAEYMLHAATYLATWRKVELLIYFSRSLQRNFLLRDMVRIGSVGVQFGNIKNRWRNGSRHF